MTAEIIPLPFRAPAHGIHPDDGWKAEARRQIGIWRALAGTFRREATTLIEKALKHEHDANELQAKLNAAEYVEENTGHPTEAHSGASPSPVCLAAAGSGALPDSPTIQGQRTADPSDGEPIELAGVGGVSALPGPGNHAPVDQSADHRILIPEASGSIPDGRTNDTTSLCPMGKGLAFQAGQPGSSPGSDTHSPVQGNGSPSPFDGEGPCSNHGRGTNSIRGGATAARDALNVEVPGSNPGPGTNSLSPLSSESGSSLPDSAPAFPYTCSGGCGARVERESYVCLECKRRPKCASCKGTGIWAADEDMGPGSMVTMSACPDCAPRPGTCTFALNDGSLCGSNPHEGTNRCPFHTFFGHTPTGGIVATAIPALDPRNIFTNSHLKCGRRCARERHLAYDLGIRSTRESAAANFGTMGHAALEAWFRASTDDERLEAAIAAIEAFDADSADPFDRAKARALIKGYHAMWIDEPWEVLAVEVELPNVPILHPDTGVQHPWAVSGGKIDVVIRKDGQVFNVDHKFLSGDTSIGSHFWRLLRMDSQISTYLDGVETLGYGKPHGHIHDVISKPGLRPLLATPEENRRYTKGGKLDKRQRLEDESPEDYEARILAAIAAAPQKFFARETVVRLDVEMEEHRRDVWDQVEAVGEAREANRFPRNVDACERYGSLCPYWRVCAGETNLDDPEHFRKVAWVHSELTAPNVNQENE